MVGFINRRPLYYKNGYEWWIFLLSRSKNCLSNSWSVRTESTKNRNIERFLGPVEFFCPLNENDCLRKTRNSFCPRIEWKNVKGVPFGRTTAVRPAVTNTIELLFFFSFLFPASKGTLAQKFRRMQQIDCVRIESSLFGQECCKGFSSFCAFSTGHDFIRARFSFSSAYAAEN